MGVLVFALVSWGLAIYVAYQLGAPKARAGWAWGLLLGWIGVIIVALLPKRDAGLAVRTTDRHVLAELEYEARLDELRRRRAAQLQR